MNCLFFVKRYEKKADKKSAKKTVQKEEIMLLYKGS